MKCEDFDLERVTDLFIIASDTRGVDTKELADNYVTLEDLWWLGLDAIEAYCHASHCFSDADAIVGYLSYSPLITLDEINRAYQGMDRIDQLLRQDAA